MWSAHGLGVGAIAAIAVMVPTVASADTGNAVGIKTACVLSPDQVSHLLGIKLPHAHRGKLQLPGEIERTCTYERTKRVPSVTVTESRTQPITASTPGTILVNTPFTKDHKVLRGFYQVIPPPSEVFLGGCKLRHGPGYFTISIKTITSGPQTTIARSLRTFEALCNA